MVLSLENRILVTIVLATLIVMLPWRRSVRMPLSSRATVDRICVVVVVPYGTTAAVGRNVIASVELLLRKAAEPSRVSVCIYDLGDSVRSHIPCYLQTFVKVARNMSITHPYHSSDSDAREWMLENLFRGEKFWMSVPPSFYILDRWDVILTGMLPTPVSILTARCDMYSKRGNFIALGEITGSRFVLVNKECLVKPTRPVPSIFWVPSISFCRSAAMIAAPPIKNGIVRNCCADATLNGIRLWTSGYDFFSMSETVVWNDRVCSEVVWRPSVRTRRRAERPLIGSIRSVRSYEAFAGIDLRRRVATRRALIGLSLNYTVTEACVKCGSVESASKLI